MPASRPRCTAPRRICCVASSLRSVTARPRSMISRRALTSPYSRRQARIRPGVASRDSPLHLGPRLSDLCFEKCGHPVPSLVGACDIVGGAALVGEGVRGVIAVDLVPDAGAFQHLL